MTIENLKELIGLKLEDDFVIRSFHIYADKINITLTQGGLMKGMTLSYNELEELF